MSEEDFSKHTAALAKKKTLKVCQRYRVSQFYHLFSERHSNGRCTLCVGRDNRATIPLAPSGGGTDRAIHLGIIVDELCLQEAEVCSALKREEVHALYRQICWPRSPTAAVLCVQVVLQYAQTKRLLTTVR
jgi:hypothetical protein